MDNHSPSKIVKHVETQANQVLRKIDTRKISKAERKILADLQQNLNDARIYTSDYELSETREDQMQNAKAGKKWLELARQNILAASEYNFFGAFDVAQLTAQIDQVIAYLK